MKRAFDLCAGCVDMGVRFRRCYAVFAVMTAALIPAGCDESFTPLAPASVDYSIFGYLDAAADTQWIRVMPIRTVTTTTPDLVGATVTLEHLGTGQVIELRDSVFRYTNHTHPDLGSEGVYVHNFWTTERIQPGATYRMIARREGEEPAEAVVSIPQDYNVEVWVSQFWPGADVFRIEGLKHIAFVKTFAHYTDTCGSDVRGVFFRTVRRDGEAYTLPIKRDTVPPRGLCGAPRLDRLELWTAGSQVPWPSGIEYATGGIAVPEEVTNISNSVGYIGGVFTKRVPYGECRFEGPLPQPQYCRLRYDASTAWLSGTVTETRCNDGRMYGATVTLRELDGSGPHQLIRKVVTGTDGQYLMGALTPGMRYALEIIGRPDREPGGGLVNIHSVDTDTIQFTPGERMRYDAGLIRYTFCSQKPSP